MASLREEHGSRRLLAQVAVIVIYAGILVGQNRSAWMGSFAALVLMGVLHLRYGRAERGVALKRDQLLVPLVVIALAVGLFLAVSQLGGSLSSRAGTLAATARDNSFQWRLGMWSKAARMARDRPLLGWGVGTFPIQQALYYHPASPSRSQRSIALTGPTLEENAHNTYLQLTAELGFPGLALYLGIFCAWAVTVMRALPRMRPGFRQGFLIACSAAVIAQVVSAVGSPAWEFAECSLFLWLILGLGMAAAGVAERGRGTSAEGQAPALRKAAGSGRSGG
jgi:O-antigen ligase